MKIDLKYLRRFSGHCIARELAELASEIYFGSRKPDFPIDVFKVLKDFGIYYKFLELDNLEGIYSPDNESMVAVVGINSRSRYERQRFTAAHELCHHIKDYNIPSMSPKESKDPIEVFANIFAAEFLMPWRYFLEEAAKYEDDFGYVKPEDVVFLCQTFGVSFESAIWNLHYYNKINFQPNAEFFANFGITRQLEILGLQSLDGLYLRNIIDSYKYIPQADTSPLWLRIKNELIYHDNRVEGLEITKEDVAEICTDLRIKRYDSIYYDQFSQSKEIVETVGHNLIYDYVYTTVDTPDRFQAKELNRKLFSLAPEAEIMGDYRQTNNHITGAIIETTDYWLIEQEMYDVDKSIDEYIERVEDYSFSEALEHAVRIHHRITQIHPFTDGNGRVSRAVLNWLIKLKNLPPVYVESKDKSRYLETMQIADQGEFGPLTNYFLERLLFSMINLNARHTLSVPMELKSHSLFV